jgi:acylphosphatase
MVESDQARLHAIVEGHVQGVGFRAFVLEWALELGLTGWVRNRWDGTVEVIAEGSKIELEKLLAALRRGPRTYTTSGVSPEWLDATGEFTRFQVRMTSG